MRHFTRSNNIPKSAIVSVHLPLSIAHTETSKIDHVVTKVKHIDAQISNAVVTMMSKPKKQKALAIGKRPSYLKWQRD